jgi:hypothetical protein
MGFEKAEQNTPRTLDQLDASIAHAERIMRENEALARPPKGTELGHEHLAAKVKYGAAAQELKRLVAERNAALRPGEEAILNPDIRIGDVPPTLHTIVSEEARTSGITPLSAGEENTSFVSETHRFEDTEKEKRIGNHRVIVFRTLNGSIYHLIKDVHGAWHIHNNDMSIITEISDADQVAEFEKTILSVDTPVKIKFIENGIPMKLETSEIAGWVEVVPSSKNEIGEMPSTMVDALQAFPQGIRVHVLGEGAHDERYFMITKGTEGMLKVQMWVKRSGKDTFELERTTKTHPASFADTELRAGGTFHYNFFTRDEDLSETEKNDPIKGGLRLYRVGAVDPL